ncbi:MAG: hypothetical protein C0392_13060 [Syntrophus sp. (in: bacteria)]|nr:hypothetical protein [Syntrophus sp. (in: bacteria)]
MQIKIRPNIEMPEIPSIIEIGDEASLREALLVVTPQLVDPATGKLRDDPDIWAVRHNGVNIHSLRDGLDTKMHEGDVIALELILMAGG